MTVRTRFAPSPTGYLHIGGVRTALFNWLFARKHGGQFILRIDDTDTQRNIAEALQPILDGFRWLGLNWDEGAEVGGPYGPYYQSQRLPRYQAAAQALVEKGLAYTDYATPEELKADREAAEKEKKSYRYDRKLMAETAAERAKFEAQGRKATIRLKMPREGECRFDDHVRGQMVVPWIQESDVVIQKSDGSCLYNLANVVDDAEMKITHVIRAEEHLSNTPRQVFMLDGLGYPRPEYAHIPFVAAPGGKRKLSKREIGDYLKNPEFKKVYEHGKAIADQIGLAIAPETFNPVIVDFYGQVGYLPDAIINYLMLLGWAHEDGKSELFTREEMPALFSLERVVKSPASFDVKKLFAFQERYYIIEQKVNQSLPYLQKAKLVPFPCPDEPRAKVRALVQAAGDRLKVAGDILDYAHFFQAADALVYDDKAFEKRLTKAPASVQLLRLFRDKLAATESFEASAMEKLTQEFVTSQNTELGNIIHALRVAVSGKAVGFGLFETLAILGKEQCLARIDRALARV